MPGKPFSTKQKKEQLQKKREKKRTTKANDSSDSDGGGSSGTGLVGSKPVLELDKPNLKVMFESVKLNEQPVVKDKREQNKFNLQFMKEPLEEIKRMKRLSYKPLVYRQEIELEADLEDFYKPGSVLDFPVRPKWKYSMDKNQLEQNEQKYFNTYLSNIFEHYPHHELSYFEMNLETWRQLWRVLEISDIILLIVDIRFPSLHFSPTFYEHCAANDKDVILVLNKIDLVPTEQVVAWKAYFKKKYPKLHVLLFSSSKQIKLKRGKHQPSANQPDQNNLQTEEEQAAIKAAAAEVYTAKAHRHLYECVAEIVKPESGVDLDSWRQLTDNLVNESLLNRSNKADEDEIPVKSDVTNEDEQSMEELITSMKTRKKFEHGFVTIGCCGFPNVGKSSLLNSLKGRKVVSVSKTPGHTKHLQTIFLTKSVRLCDCPGLVFPSLSPKPLQVLAGIYPIAQLQEPYSSIRYLAENCAMIENLRIVHPSVEDLKHEQFYKDKTFEWTPADICEAWAIKRGYLTAKAGRPDVYRAANELLRMALDGRLCISLKPKGFLKDREEWKASQENKELMDVIRGVEVVVKRKLENVELAKNSEDLSDDEENEEIENFDRVESSSDKESGGDLSETDQEGVSSNPYALLGED